MEAERGRVLVEESLEIVVILDGAPPAEDATDDVVVAALRDALATGMSTKDAVADVARALTVPRRHVYALATALAR